MKLMLTLFAIFITGLSYGQRPSVAPALSKAILSDHGVWRAGRDTVMESDTSKENKEARYFYLTISNNAYVNTTGGFAKRYAPAFEVGRTYGIFDVGIATGRINCVKAGSDTTHYLEFRPTINVFTKGRFSEALCLGAGGVFGAKQALMTEICNSINFNVSENVGIAVAQGYCFFDGVNNNRTAQYFGFNLTYNLLRAHSINKQRKKEALISDR